MRVGEHGFELVELIGGESFGFQGVDEVFVDGAVEDFLEKLRAMRRMVDCRSARGHRRRLFRRGDG